MCGIAGLISADGSQVSRPRLQLMTDVLAHRGPDGDGFWISEDGRVGLGHRRLSVIDLSPGGAQPMFYGLEDRYVLVYNGEIYNYLELKQRLLNQGYTFKTGTDTEVILALYHLKQEGCLSELDGMFAFALYDRQEQTLFCARDRFGEKPFYYTHEPGHYFYFGSEMKAIWRIGIPRTVSHTMLYRYLAYGMVQDPMHKGDTFFEEIFSLEPAHFLKLQLGSMTIEKARYWDLNLGDKQVGLDERQASQQLRDLLSRSVTRRLRSDVSVGSSFSGGLDSSIILSLAASRMDENKFNTFSARFPGFSRDEGRYMALMKERYPVISNDVFPNGEDLLSKINSVLYHQEEPLGSASVLAQFEVMKAAKQKGVTVLLDGQGADEIMGGYGHHHLPWIWESLNSGYANMVKSGWYYLSRKTDNHVNLRLIKDLFRILSFHFPSLSRELKIKRMAARQSFQPFFEKGYDDTFGKTALYSGLFRGNGLPSLDALLYFETCTMGLPELLRYADRNAMAHSREIRLPFLDHELVSFIFSLPGSMKMNGPWSKFLLRKAFEEMLPSQIAWRRDKVGYEPPQQTWMSSPVVQQEIKESIGFLVREGILHPRLLRTTPHGHGAFERGDGSWNILMAKALMAENSI